MIRLLLLLFPFMLQAQTETCKATSFYRILFLEKSAVLTTEMEGKLLENATNYLENCPNIKMQVAVAMLATESTDYKNLLEARLDAIIAFYVRQGIKLENMERKSMHPFCDCESCVCAFCITSLIF